MKKFVIFAMNLLLVIALLGSGTKNSESESDSKYKIDNSVSVEKLKDIDKFRFVERTSSFASDQETVTLISLSAVECESWKE